MSFVIVDVEADGPYPLDYSMVSFGAVLLDNTLSKTFYGKTKPISDKWVAEALVVSGIDRKEHLTFDDPVKVMQEFNEWLLINSKGRPIFVSDNPAFDWQWINSYFHKFLGKNPFGHSGRRIGDMYAGMQMDISKSNVWKKFRTTKHTHNPVDDAKGNAEALLEMRKRGLRISL